MILFEQEIQDYINTVEEHKQALQEIKNFILDGAFNSGGDLKDWLDSFNFGKNNMMWPIPTIVENECEICVTFYYLPQIKVKDTSNQVPRPFPLPSNPINITWAQGLPKIESNWKFELFPQPPVTICYRKDKPGCRPEKPKPSCLPQEEYDQIIEEIKNNPNPTIDGENDSRFPLLPICLPNNEQPCDDGAKPKPGQSWLFKVYYPVKIRQFGLNCYREGTTVWCRNPIESNDPPIYYVGGFMFVNDGETFGAARARYWQGSHNRERGAESDSILNNRLQQAPYFDFLCQVNYRLWWTKYEPIVFDYDKSIQEPAGNPPINQETQMDCCEEVLKILRKMQKDMHQLMKWTGAASGGFEVPEYLHDESPGSDWLSNAWDAVTPDKKLKLNSMPEYYRWQLEKFQEFFGTFPIVFSDDKENEMGFPNIAVALQSLLMKQVGQEKSLAVIEKGIIKNILETGSTREQAILATSLLNALTDYFELILEDDVAKVKHYFRATPITNMSVLPFDEEDYLLEFLEDQEFDTKVVKFDPNIKINGRKSETFSQNTRRIIQILEILKAAHTIPINHQMPEVDILKYMGELRKFYKGQTLDNKDLNDDSSDLSQWFNKVEQQFGADINPPTNSTTAPWGQNLDERPKIIIKGDSAPQDPDA